MESKPAKILIKLPSRGRPERFFRAMDSIVLNLADLDNYLISCTLDEDDSTMNNPQTIERVLSYRNTKIEWGLSDSKVSAINRSMPNYKWDILIVGSDDIFFDVYGFDDIVRLEMKNNFPDGDGYLHFREADSKEFLNVMTVCDNKYYSRFNYIYHPSYLSLWCDNEQTEVAKRLGRYAFVNYGIMVHRNSAYGYSDCPADSMFLEQQSLWSVDEANFMKRKEINFDL